MQGRSGREREPGGHRLPARGQNNLILEVLNSVIKWEGKSIYETPIRTLFCEAMPKVTCSIPTTPPSFFLQLALLWSVQ